MHQRLRFGLVLLLGGTRQLRGGDGGERPIRDRDDDGDIGGNSENPRVVKSHLGGDEEGG